MIKKILIATSVEQEKEAVLRGIGEHKHIDVVVVGVGSAKAAANTAIALTKNRYDLVINMGIAGGFRDKTDIGSVIIADEIICSDLGSETQDGFLTVEQLGFGTNRYVLHEQLVASVVKKLHTARFPMTKGPILTVSTTTGTEATMHKLKNRFPHAVGEAMEGYGVAVAAHEFSIPVLEIRTISNFIGPRDRKSWKIPDALNMLQLVVAEIQEVL